MSPLRLFAALATACLLTAMTRSCPAQNSPESIPWIPHRLDPKVLTFPLQISSPSDRQVFQRQTRGEGIVHVAFSLPPATSTATNFTADLRLIGQGEDRWWRDIPNTRPGIWNVNLRMRAGGWYRFEAHVYSPEHGLWAEGGVAHVGVGEVLVVAGQSNSANHGDETLTSDSDQVSTRTPTGWIRCKDPQPGATGQGGSFLPPLGDLLYARWKVPIGFIATGVGATSVREWLPAGSTFTNPPTIEHNVARLPDGRWSSRGNLFPRLASAMQDLGTNGLRATLWHQGESDANQNDPSRTLPGIHYASQMKELIQATRHSAGWQVPWMVALVSYHSPTDRSSDDIREAQRSLAREGISIEGPDSDALAEPFRDQSGKGIHFSGKGLRELARQWDLKLAPWMEAQLNSATNTSWTRGLLNGTAPPALRMARENITIAGRPGFILWPPSPQRTTPQPWIWYAPTLPGYPDEAERWLHSQFLKAGLAIAGVDVGEAYGSPSSLKTFDALHQYLTREKGFAPQACLLGRSRGGLWASSYAIAHPERVAGILGIYPVYDFRTYPGLPATARAYGLSPPDLEARIAEFNPILRASHLADSNIPIALIHGDDDKVVPLGPNSQTLIQQYVDRGKKDLIQALILPGQGHNYEEAFFRSQDWVDFGIRRARAGASATHSPR